jgi:hypothetical protein
MTFIAIVHSLRLDVSLMTELKSRPVDRVNGIAIGDCLIELKKIPSASADLIFSDPPYNLQL